MKTCRICNGEKTENCFYKSKNMKDGRLTECKVCYIARTQKNYHDRRAYYLEYHQNRYRNDERWMMINKYSGIVSRSFGKKNHKYTVTGKKYLTRNAFEKWWKDNRSTFLEIHSVWKASGYDTKLSPSIDRINNKKGYIPSNMQWLTHSKNSSKHKK